jgi:hypothetical protein
MAWGDRQKSYGREAPAIATQSEAMEDVGAREAFTK